MPDAHRPGSRRHRPSSPFDGQAPTFDRRTGVPDDVARRVAEALVRLVDPASTDVVLEIGAGTGTIGQALIEHPLSYVGLDISAPMLDQFRARAEVDDARVRLVVGDAEERWPAGDQTVRAIFGSRSLHLFSVDHVVSEALRVSAPPSGWLIVGRIERDPSSARVRMKRKLHELLTARGHAPRSGERNRRALLEACVSQGATLVEPIAVADWSHTASPAAALEAWSLREGLAGTSVSDDIQREVLAELRTWAEASIGDLNEPMPYRQTYVLEAVRLPSTLAPR